MWQQDLLFYISVIGPVVTLAATVWGLSRETSITTESGEKRLTREGQVAVALAVGSALIATTAFGLGELIKRQNALAAETAKADERREAARQRTDDRRWQAIRLAQLRLQQRFLSDLQREEARRQAGEILASQRLFAAVEAQRDRGIVAGNRIFQIAQSQQIILQSQPLTSLHVQLTLGGFSAQEFAEFVEGASEVAGYRESDDDYGRLLDSRPALDDANLFRKILAPAIHRFAGAASGSDRDAGPVDAILAIDLVGEGSWLLPIGTTEQARGRGYVVNAAWLSDVGRPYPTGIDAQDFGLCRFPSIALDRSRRTVTVTWTIPGVCLPTAIHRAADVAMTARLAENPRIAIFRGAQPFPGEATNIARGNEQATASCWRNSSSAGSRSRRYIELVAVPNSNPSIGVRKMLTQRNEVSVDFQASSYDDSRHLGLCTLFQ